MLTFAEEIFLLSLDEDSGKPSIPGGKNALHRALVGAVLCELSFLNKIDSDRDFLYVVDDSHSGMAVLDRQLDVIAARKNRESLHYWMEVLLSEASSIERMVVEELKDKGIIREESAHILWVFPTRRYPLIDDEEILDVESRLRQLIVSQEIPEPREAVLVSLVYACGLFETMFTAQEYHLYKERIKTLAHLDIFGSEVIRLVNEMAVITGIMPPNP